MTLRRITVCYWSVRLNTTVGNTHDLLEKNKL